MKITTGELTEKGFSYKINELLKKLNNESFINSNMKLFKSQQKQDVPEEDLKKYLSSKRKLLSVDNLPYEQPKIAKGIFPWEKQHLFDEIIQVI